VYVANRDGASVSVIERSRGRTVDTIAVGSTPAGLTYDGRHLYATSSAEGSVSIISAATRTVVDTIAVGSGPTAIAYDGTNVWVSDTDGNSMHKLLPR
jgi:YVTN family beta-propeller protein